MKQLLAIFLVFALVACAQELPSAPLTASGEPIVLTSDETGQYAPAAIRVKAGSTVRIEGDTATLIDGMDTVIVDGYDVSKKIVPGDNVLEFVADKSGVFDVHCANGMGNAKLIVE